jgi:hypothetical protein
MHGVFIMLIPMLEGTWQEAHMHFMLSDIGLQLEPMLQNMPFCDGMAPSIFMLHSFMVLQS